MKVTKDSRYNKEIVEKVMGEICTRGVYIDLEEAEKVLEDLDKLIEEFERKAKECLGEGFEHVNLKSTKLVGQIFNDVLNLSRYANRTKSGGLSYDGKVLKKMALDGIKFAEYLADFRSYSSIRSKVVEILKVVDEDGYVYPDYSHGETNRVSFNNPGLSNVHKSARSIISAPPGYKIVNMDYKQQEPYLLVNMLGIEEFKDMVGEGKDFYRGFSYKLLGREVTDEERDVVKLCVLASAYGSKLTDVLDSLKHKPELKKLAIDIRDYINNIPEIIKKRNYIENETVGLFQDIKSYFGTTRELPVYGRKEDLMRKKWLFNSLLRIAFNNEIQITGADMLFFAFESIENLKKELGLTSEDLRVYLVIHDEILVIVKEELITDELVEKLVDSIRIQIEDWKPIGVDYQVCDNYKGLE